MEKETIKVYVPSDLDIDSMLLLAFMGRDGVITLLNEDVTYLQQTNAAKTMIDSIACSKLSGETKMHLLRIIRDYASLVIDIGKGS